MPFMGAQESSEQNEEPAQSTSLLSAVKDRPTQRCATMQSSENAFCDTRVVEVYTEVLSDTAPPSLSQCTGYLIDSNSILTNIHCIKGSLEKPSIEELVQNCQKNTLVKSGSGKALACHSLALHKDDLSHTNEKRNLLSRDFVVIKTKEAIAKINPSRLSQKGLAKGELLRVQTLEFPMNLNEAPVQTPKTCRVYQENDVMDLSFHSETFSFLGDCQLREGNSGSILKDINGEIVGIAFAKLDTDMSLNNWKDIVAGTPFEVLDNSFDDIDAGFALSFKCLERIDQESIIWKDEIEHSCAMFYSQDDFISVMQNRLDMLQDEVANLMVDLINHPSKEYFEFEAMESGFEFRVQPRCFTAQTYRQNNSNVSGYLKLPLVAPGYRTSPLIIMNTDTYKVEINTSTHHMIQDDLYVYSEILDGADNGQSEFASVSITDCL